MAGHEWKQTQGLQGEPRFMRRHRNLRRHRLQSTTNKQPSQSARFMDQPHSMVLSADETITTHLCVAWWLGNTR
jgi:hypothetical protein